MTPFLILFIFVIVFWWSERDYRKMKKFVEQMKKDMEEDY